MPPKGVRLTRSTLPNPLPPIFKDGYITVELKPEGYEAKPYRVIIVRCSASNCTRQFESNLQYITSTGNWWKHIQNHHPELIRPEIGINLAFFTHYKY